MKILLAVDGSEHSLAAVNCLIEHAGWYRDKPHVELVTVHAPVPRLPGMNKAVGKNQIQDYYKEEGKSALAAAEAKLGTAGIKYESHVLVGEVAKSIVDHAAQARCDQIFIGTHGRSAAANMLLGSTATEVLHISKTPVLLVR